MRVKFGRMKKHGDIMRYPDSGPKIFSVFLICGYLEKVVKRFFLLEFQHSLLEFESLLPG